MVRRLILAALLAWGSCAAAQLPAPLGHVDLPQPGNANTFGVIARYGPDGLLYVWDGSHVLQEAGANSSTFLDLSAPGMVGSGSADAGPINFTRDGATIVVGNGAGGLLGGSNNGLIFTIPAAGGTTSTPAADVNYGQDLLPLPPGASLPGAGAKMLVDEGNATFSGSSVSIVDLASGVDVRVIDGIPGAATSVALDGSGRLYAGVGFGADRGDIRRFDWAMIEQAFTTGTPLQWVDGELFNPASSANNSGAGMFFDGRGYLFVGGNEGLTVFGPEGVGRSYDIGPGYASVIYNPVADTFLVTSWGSNNGNIYAASAFVPEPGALLLLAGCAGGLLVRRRRSVGPREVAS